MALERGAFSQREVVAGPAGELVLCAMNVDGDGAGGIAYKLDVRDDSYSCQYCGSRRAAAQWTVPETVPKISGRSACTIHALACSIGMG